MSSEYLDHSIEVLRSVDVEELGQKQLADDVGHGSGFGFYPLENFTADKVAIGLKVPHSDKRNMVDLRLQIELPIINMLLERVPEIAPYMPRFMGQVTVGKEIVAVITEDVTNGGRKKAWSTPVSPSVRGKLESAFCSEGESLYAIFDDEVLDRSLAFDVEGEERWLDFTPGPIKFDQRERFGEREQWSHVHDQIEQLTLQLPPDSLLAQKLTS